MKKLSLALSILALVVSAGVTRAQAGHEYSPLVEKTVNYKNWKLPNITSAKDEELRSLIAGKKLVMIVYFAPWCGNWRNEAPIAAKLYEKYKAQGFQVSASANTRTPQTLRPSSARKTRHIRSSRNHWLVKTNRKLHITSIVSSPATPATGVHRGISFSSLTR